MVRTYHPFWKEIPFVRIVLPFASGIWAQDLGFFTLPLILTLSAATLFVLVISERAGFYHRLRWLFLRGIYLNLTLFLFGGTLFHYRLLRLETEKNSVLASPGRPTLMVTVTESLSRDSSYGRLLAEITWVQDHIAEHLQGRVILYIRGPQDPELHRAGQRFVIQQSLEDIVRVPNPGAPDLREWYRSRDILYRVSLQHTDCGNRLSSKVPWLRAFTAVCREKILAMLGDHISTDNARGLAEALLLGYRKNLDRNLMEAYRDTGIMHVIAVSGMHLALLYGMLSGVLNLFIRAKRNVFARSLIVLSAIWLFTLLTGGQASIVRSAVMLSLFETGKWLRFHSHPLNSLAASAFLILVFRPVWLFDIGFQLSYAAVAGILLYLDAWTDRIRFFNPFAGGCWKLICVTLSAQWLTLPILIWNFHQFPLLFLLTNLVAVPLTSFVLILEIILCLAFPLTQVAAIAGMIAEDVLIFLNRYVVLMHGIGFGTIRHLYINAGQYLAIYLIMISGGFALWKKRTEAIWLLLIGILALTGASVFKHSSGNRQQVTIVTFLRQEPIILIIQGRSLMLCTMGPGPVSTGGQKILQDAYIHYSCRGPVRQMRIQPATRGILLSEEVEGAIRTIVPSIPEKPATRKKWILLLQEPALLPLDMLDQFDNRLWIAGLGFPLWKIQDWKEGAEGLHLRFHSVQREGACILTGTE